MGTVRGEAQGGRRSAPRTPDPCAHSPAGKGLGGGRARAGRLSWGGLGDPHWHHGPGAPPDGCCDLDFWDLGSLGTNATSSHPLRPSGSCKSPSLTKNEVLLKNSPAHPAAPGQLSPPCAPRAPPLQADRPRLCLLAASPSLPPSLQVMTHLPPTDVVRIEHRKSADPSPSHSGGDLLCSHAPLTSLVFWPWGSLRGLLGAEPGGGQGVVAGLPW